MGQRLRVALAVGLVFVLPLSCGRSAESDDDDDAGSGQGGADDAGKGGSTGGSGNAAKGGAGGGGARAGNAGGGGASAAGGVGTAGVFTLPGGGRSISAGGRGGSGGASGGSAAATGEAGASAGGRGGSAGAGTVTGVLGASCVKDTDCDDPTLRCVQSSDFSDSSGPARGLCTKPCSTSDDCADYGATYCFAFTDQDQYCIEACTTGSLGSPKCHSRDDVACSLVGLSGNTLYSCTSNADCASGELCDPGTLSCRTSVTGCVPLCAGDFQCGSGQYCNFTTGLCVGSEPSGLPLGAECTLPRGGAVDPCQGFCSAGSDGQQGICESLCTLQASLVGCGWDGKGAPDHVCLFSTILSPPGDAAFGDVAICGALCDCSADCLRNGDVCIDESGGDVETIWNRKGYCRALDAGETQADTFASCSTGAGGQAGAGP
jgi:hypothetical protein